MTPRFEAPRFETPARTPRRDVSPTAARALPMAELSARANRARAGLQQARPSERPVERRPERPAERPAERLPKREVEPKPVIPDSPRTRYAPPVAPEPVPAMRTTDTRTHRPFHIRPELPEPRSPVSPKLASPPRAFRAAAARAEEKAPVEA